MVWTIPLIILVLSILQISLIRGIHAEKTPKLLALHPIVSPIIGVVLYYIKDEFAFFFIILNFAIIFIILLSRTVKSVVSQRVEQKNSAHFLDNPILKEVFGFNGNAVNYQGLNNPLYNIIFRILFIALIIFGTNSELDNNFTSEFRFQIFGSICLFLLSIGLTLKNINYNQFLDKVSEKAKNEKKPVPKFLTEFHFQKFAKTIYWMIGFAFIIIALMMGIPQEIWRIIKIGGFPYIIYALLFKFSFDFFATLNNPLEAILINFNKARELFQNYIMAIFVGVALIISLSFFGLKNIPYMLLGFNAILLYEEILTYKKLKIK